MYEEFLKGKKSIGRCPRCGKDTLTYDENTGKIHCSNCGYEQIIARTTSAKSAKLQKK